MTDRLWKIFWNGSVSNSNNLYKSANLIGFAPSTIRNWIAHYVCNGSEGLSKRYWEMVYITIEVMLLWTRRVSISICIQLKPYLVFKIVVATSNKGRNITLFGAICHCIFHATLQINTWNTHKNFIITSMLMIKK
jgi:hypothetical protein